MDKIKDLMKNKKLLAVSIMSFIALLICVIANIYVTNIVKHTNMYFYNSGVVSPTIVNNGIVEQEFILREGDEGVALKFATYTTKITYGTIDVEIYNDSKECVSSFSVPANEMQDNLFYEFVFEDVAEDLWNQKCLLRLTFRDIGDQMISIYMSDTDTLDCSCMINGENQANDLVARGLNQTDGLKYHDIRLFYIFVFVIVLSYVIYINKLEDIKQKFKYLVGSLKKNKRNIVLTCIVIVGSGILAYLGEIIWSLESEYKNPYRCIMLFVLFLIFAITIIYKKYVWKYAHVYFFVLIMAVGMFMIISVPPVHISWDEQTHYEDAAYMSWGGTGKISDVDQALSLQSAVILGDNPFQKENRLQQIEAINAVSSTDLVKIENTVAVRWIAYIPSSIGLYVGRLLDFNAYHTFMLGKMANLFSYAVVIALAIKNVQNRGKILIATVGLIPTSLFMAVSYSYDWWVISLVILGFSVFIGEIQNKGKIGLVKMGQSVGIIMLGVLVKAVYFPLLFPLMLLKKEHYEESKKSRVLVVLGMVVLLASFILPMLISGAGEGDIRGGTDVNSTEQIKFILSNVFGYAEILINFLWTYLSPDMAYQYLISMAYLGDIPYVGLCIIVLTIAAVADNSEQALFRSEAPWVRWGACLGVFGSIVLVATALYVSFTPVALGTINGCQARYILPVVFPLLFFLGENKIKIEENQKRDVLIFVSLAMVFVIMNGWYNVVISTY